MLPCVSVKQFLHVFWFCALQDQLCNHNLIIQFSDGFCTRKRLKITRPRPRNNVRRETPKKPRQPREARSETKPNFKSEAPKITSKSAIKSGPKKPDQPRQKHSKTVPEFEREIGTKYVQKSRFLDPEKPHQPRGEHLKRSLGYFKKPRKGNTRLAHELNNRYIYIYIYIYI